MIDTHAHLQDERLLIDIQNVINNAKQVGVNKIVCASSNIALSQQAVDIANNFEGVFATVGIHPEDALDLPEDYLQILNNLAKNKKVVAIGEIGLDYHYEFASRQAQKKLFVEQIILADKLNLPIVVHARDCTQDVMNIFKENLIYLQNGVCVHCFSMSTEILKECLSYGFYISIGGVLTFKNSKNAPDIVKECPLERLMLETDCPYLAPEPFRGKLNEPKYIPYIAQKIADIKNISLEQVIQQTDKNAQKFFNI